MSHAAAATAPQPPAGAGRCLVLLTTGLGRGGAEAQVVALATGFATRGWRVHVISMLEPVSFTETLQRAGIGLHTLRMRRGIPDPRAMFRLARLLRVLAPDVVHSHMIHANLLARITRLILRIPRLLCTAHSVDEGHAWRMRAYRATERLATLTTHISEAGRLRWLATGAATQDAMVTVPNGVDLGRFTTDPARRDRTRDARGLGERFTWVIAGRLEEVKQHAVLLDAVAQLIRRPSHPLMTVLVAGDGALATPLQAQASALGLDHHVHFLGLRDDMPALLEAADAAVLCSRMEGLPMALLEASAAGLPCVTTDVGGCREVVRHEQTGYVVPPHDAAALADAMARLMACSSAERKGMGAAARAHVLAYFDLAAVLDRWEALYAPRSIHVAFFLPTLDGGGAERAIVHAAGATAAAGFRTALVVGRADGAYRQEIPRNVELVDLGVQRLRGAVRPLARWLAREQPQVMLSAMTHTNVVALASRAWSGWRGRLVVSERNCLSETWRGLPGWKRRLQALVLRWMYGHADAVAAVSQGVADDVAEVLGHPRVAMPVLYNATAQPALAAQAVQPLSDPWLAPGAPPCLVAVGRLEPQKDYPTLLQAMAAARARCRITGILPPRLLVLGDGEQRATLAARCTALGLDDCVRFVGFAANPFAYMARAHALVLSSRFEGLPNVLIQALAVGCPVVSTDCPSGPAEILDGGRHGTLVPVGNADALAAALYDCITQPRRRVSPAAVYRFSPEAVTQALISVLGLDGPPGRTRVPQTRPRTRSRRRTTAAHTTGAALR